MKQDPKQKLNKSFENLLKSKKKNLSTSPRRNSSNKKGGSKSATRKKDLTILANKSGTAKQLYSMRDLNFFIKTIEKDLSEKYDKQNPKDFNSVPTTPKSILKKIEDQVKAMNSQQQPKSGLSNTCPNMTHLLGSLNESGPVDSRRSKDALHELIPSIGSHNHTPSNVSSSGYTLGGDNFSFSKTQKLDLKEHYTPNTVSMFGSHKYQKDARERSAEDSKKKRTIPEDSGSSSLVTIKKKGSSKQSSRIRGSSAKGSSSSKLNKSAHNI